ncbi:family 78 glycoside hydrolase catalytic domain [Microbacterium sp. X-17]|uniref:family 78 glycoside hydrolase catalytic domain n=1 Tax=Microbacterium sp. X-17 TaxID=3144404 RepID=UPI0031F47CC9
MKTTSADSRATVDSVWLENRRAGSALGIDESAPRIAWTADSPSPDDAVELELTRDKGTVERHISHGGAQRLIDWPFAPLTSREAVTLRLRFNDEEGFAGPSDWSAPLAIEAGLLDREDWAVPFVSPSASAPQGAVRPGHLLRAEWDNVDLGVDVTKVQRARIYSTAHGVYELELNGRSVSDDLLSPGWTSYSHRLRYQTHDVTDILQSGRNAIGVWLADGWYRGRIGFDGGLWDVYGNDVAVLLQLELTLEDGSVVDVPLTDGWRSHASPVTAAALYEGESYDSRLLPEGFSAPGFDDSTWQTPTLLDLSDFSAKLEAPTGPPVRVTEVLKPINVEAIAGSRIRLDFGQNIAGKLRIRVNGPAGHTVTLHHAEVLEDGALGVRPLRSAVSIDRYTLSGNGVEEWTPRFTVHGFRFAEIENWPGAIETLDVEALVVHTDMQRTGWFESSHPGLNRLHENVVWSMRDNFVDLPTDCPQRDERLGWTGDIQVFAPTALRLFGAHGTLKGWLRDVAYEQGDQGHVPNFVPWIECGFPNHPTAAWGDAAVIVPWEMYQHDGDLRVLRDQYDSMRGWVDLVDRLSGHTGLWNTGFQLGDWLDPAAPPDNPGESHTDKSLVATAYHVRTSQILAATAELLGKTVDAARYRSIADRAVVAFQAEFISPHGRVVSDTVTSIALAIAFDLFANEDQLRVAGRRLGQLVEASDFRISTGFVGTPIICDALVRVGELDAAYHLLLQEELPSWLYPVSMGATTIWERWDSMLPDGTINPGDMTSFNHYALGAVAGFLHRVVAGLDSAEPGWRTLRIEPRPGGGLTHASASHLTPLGPASSSWNRVGRHFTANVLVPPGATATVVLPEGGGTFTVGAGSHTFQSTFRDASDDPRKPSPRRW